jgi:hypothetical protein
MHHDASRDAPPTSFIKPHAKDKNVWGASIALQEIHGGMWSKWSKGAWTWLKAKASSGRSNNASEGVDENIWKVQPREARGHEATKQAWAHWRRTKLGGAERPLGRSDQAGWPTPLRKPLGARLPQVSHLPSPLFVCSSV